MLACTETITLVRHIAENAGDSYESSVIPRASWFAKTIITTSADGATPSSSFEVRIPTTDDINVNTGDYVVKGELSGVTSPKDLKGTEHFRVTTIGDNRRGRLPHWRLSGS